LWRTDGRKEILEAVEEEYTHGTDGVARGIKDSSRLPRLSI
jgi:hypothetical protein